MKSTSQNKEEPTVIRSSKYPVYLSKEDFYSLIEACCDTLQRHKDGLYELYCQDCRGMNIQIRCMPDELVTMTTTVEHSVKTNETRYQIFY